MIFVVGMSVLFLSIMGTSVQHVSSLMFAIIFLLSLSAVKDWAALYSSQPKLEKLFLIAFVFYVFAGALSFYNVEDVDKYIKLFERYFRFLMIVPVYLLIIKKNISVLRYLQLGAIVSGPFLFMIAIFSYI